MNRFTLIVGLITFIIMNLVVKNGNAQCNMEFNMKDSLGIVELNRLHDWDVTYNLTDTLGECYVESIGFVWSGFDENTSSIGDFPFLNRLSFAYCNFVNLNSFDYSTLPSLEELDFYEIDTSDPTFPDFNIPTLKSLSMTLVNISHPIPDFANLPDLETLFLVLENNNNPIADFSNLPKLESLTIEGSSVPDFNNISQLKLLHIRSQSEFPNFSNLPLLENLHLSHSNYVGTVQNYSHIPLLNKLKLTGFKGVIPNFHNLPVLNELIVCDINNDFIGPIPTLDNCPLLNINNVDFSCVRPAPEPTGCSISESDSLELVNFYEATDGDNWQVNNGWLTENMTSWWGIDFVDTLGKCRVNKILIRGINEAVELPALNLPFLEELILDYNNFTGNIPDLSNLTNLKILNLGVNGFTGSLPNLSNLTQLEEINLSQNILEDVITDYPNQPNLKILDLFGNQLTGELPNFDNNTELRQLNLSNNLLTGNIPNFQSIPNLNYLNVSNNQLNGTIPNFSNLVNLYTLNVADNQLTGGLPNFSNLPALQSLFVEGNQLSGRIPNFSNLPILEELVVCENTFEGTAPNFNLSPLLNVEAIDFTCLQAAKVSGFAYYDANENCIYDEGDITLPNGLISVNKGENYQPIDENGYYEIALEVGTNFISFIQTSPLWQSDCEDTQTVTSLTIDDVSEIDFANQPNIDCTELTVDIGTPFLRRCFKNTYTVQYCNQGTQPAADAYIEIDFEPEIIPMSASIPYEENNNLLTFQLGEIGIGECGSFTVMDSVACDAPLSSTGCVEAHIYPDEFCTVPSALWDGANLSVYAFCIDNDSIQFVIENLGNDMGDHSQYKMYVEDVLNVQGDVQLASGAAKVLNYPATGATYRVSVEQTPGHPSQDNPQAFFEFCGDGNFSTGFINSQLLPDKDEFLDIDCEEIIGSYDPNDKLVTPTGVGDSNEIYKGDELTYKIRFQNTGNDTAFTVVLVDTLDFEHLNISTLEILNSSHPYTLSIEDAQILTFTFNDILLVDSTTNEPTSHGFVTFKIDQFKENEIGDVIENKAYIYFDYNEPIVTPTVFNTVAEPRIAANFQFIPLTVGVESALINHLFAKVYPNPASEVFYIELPDEVLHQYPNLQLEMYNTTGHTVVSSQFNYSKQSIDIADLTKGVFYYKLFSNKNTIANGKLLIQ